MHKFYIYPGNYSYIIKEGLLRRGNWQEDNDNSNPFMDCNFIWKPTNLSISEYNKLDGTTKARPKNFVQVFNHFENIRGICTKTGLVRSLKKYYQTNVDARNASYKAFDSTPTSFLITAGVEDSEYASFVARYKQIAKQDFIKEAIPQKHCEGNYWLVKPANLNQGRGIEVFKNLKDINNFLNTRPNDSFWVVQKYVEHPLLYRDRKFDIRVWVVVTTKNEIFLYKQAYIRTSSDEYDLKTSKNYVHLTNNCLQQHGDKYGKHEDGNTLPLSILDEYLKEVYPDLDVNLAAHILPRIRDLIIDTFMSSPNLNPSRRKNVFEFFGFDFLIDQDLRTWLIEVNTNPYLGTPNAFIGNLLPHMIDDMLEIAVDPIFPPKIKPRSDGRPNDYELIYCEQGSSYHNGPLNMRTPFTKNVYPIQSLMPPDFQKKLNQLAKSQEPKHYYEFSSPVPHQEEGHAGHDDANTNIHARSSSVEVKKANGQAYDKHNIDSIYKELCLMTPYKTDVSANVARQIERVMSYIKNWELLSKKDVKTACKALLLIAESAGGALLEEQSIVLTISKLLRSHEVKSEIKLTLIETINILAKDIYLRKKLICNHLLQNLITICLSSCDEKGLEEHSKGFVLATLKCVVNLGCIFNRKLYIPGETREATKLRSFFIAQGGVIALWIISQKSVDPEMKEYCSKHFLSLLEISDFEKQLQVLDLAASMPNTASEADGNAVASQKDVIEENKETENKAQIEAIFFRTGEFPAIEKTLNLKGDQNSKYLGKVIQFTKEMLNVLPMEKLKQEFADYIKVLKEEFERREKREAEERERRQIAETEKLKKEEIKKKDLDDQRKAALDHFEKRVMTMLKKQQADNERRQKELEEIKQKEMEARRKNIEMLINKKEERERRQKRHQPQKQGHKKSKNRTYSEESQDHGEQQNVKFYDLKTSYNSVNMKNKSSIGVVGSTTSSAILHQQTFTNNTDNSMRKGPYREKSEDSTVDGQKGLILNQQDFVKTDSNRSSPSQLQKDPNMPVNLNDSPRNMNGVHYLTGGIPKARRKAEELNQSENAVKENSRSKSKSHCKLPKLQGVQNPMMERIAQSPYLKTTVNKRISSIHVRS